MAIPSISVFKRRGRKNYECEFKDPESGRTVRRSLKTSIRREADQRAGEILRQLKEGQWAATRKTSWRGFRAAYEQDDVPFLAKASQDKIRYVLDRFEKLIGPETLQHCTTANINKYVRLLRESGLAPTTIAGHLRTLKAAIRWAHRNEMLLKLPSFKMPRGAASGKMKGTPLTNVEFERILAAVRERDEQGKYAVDPSVAAEWERFLSGLFWSGLRLGEALKLSWDTDEAFGVNISAERPLFRIHSSGQKNRKTQLVPIAPEFARTLIDTPESERTGFVFALKDPRTGRRHSTTKAGKTVRAIADVAGVDRTPHDFRRAFGTRWASRVMPNVLKDLMRHKTIQTTMSYYVFSNAVDTADSVWAAVERTDHETPQPTRVEETSESHD